MMVLDIVICTQDDMLFHSPEYKSKFDKENDVIKVILDLQKNIITFIVNGVKCPRCMKVKSAQYRYVTILYKLFAYLYIDCISI